MHIPAPRSHSEATKRSEVLLESWTQQFLPSQSVGAQWRWMLLIGVFIAGALFPVGRSSNAANENHTESVSEKLRPPVQENGQPAISGEAPLPAGKPESLPTTDSQPSPVSSSTTVTTVTPAASVSSAIESASAALVELLPKRTVKLTFVVDGKSRPATATDDLNVFQALVKAGVELQMTDRIFPDAKTPVRDGLKVRVETVREKLETRDEALSPGFRVQLSSRIAPGSEQLIQYGKSGTSEVTEKVTFVGGNRVRKVFVSRKTAVPTQDKVIALGVDNRFLPQSVRYHKRYARAFQLQRQMSARAGSPRDRMASDAPQGSTLRPVKSMIVHTSGYAAGPAGGSLGNYTATGMRCVRGAVATDPRVIPLGTKLYIEGYGYAFACDTGGAIKGKRIDLAFNTVRECFQHGRRTAKVWILAE